MQDFQDKFHWADYLLFGLSLAVGIVVGIVLAIREKWLTQSSESYLMADRQMNWFLVAMSFLASIMNARLFVAFTTEFYYSGFIIIWLAVSYYVGAIFVAIVIIPKFYRLGFNVTSAYEYFQHRFNYPVRVLVSFFYFTLTMLYMSVALYIPSVVLSQVSVMSIYWSIFLGAAVCLFYTGFGGMKAVIWVDSIQIFIILIGMFALTIKGSIDAGGIVAVWEKYSGIGERNNWDDIGAEPWNWYSVWNIVFMWGILMAGMMGADQTVLQRYMTVPDLRRAQASILVGTAVGVLFLGQVAVLGMVIFASLGGNDPLITKQITQADQIMPYFLMYSLGDYHGIPGLVVAALFAATLSTLSSGQSALAAVFLEDFVRPLHKFRTGKPLSKKTASTVSRVLGILIGVAVLAISMAVPLFGGTLLSLSLTIQSFVLGPVLGLMIVAFFMVWVESWGAFVGVLCSFSWAVMMWVGEREFGHKLRKDFPPLFHTNYTVAIRLPEPTAEPTLWDVSYTWYTFLDICVLIVVANIVSILVHIFKKCCIKGYSIRDTFPSKTLRYTCADFLVGIGCRKNEVVYNKETEMDDITDNDNEKNWENLGKENLSYDSDNLAYNSDRL